MLVSTLISVVVTIASKAEVDAQAGAYATGVLASMTSAAVAVPLTEWRRGHRGTSAFFGAVAVVFTYTITVTILDRPEGLLIALIFIAMIVVTSLVSRISRSTELRVQKVTFDNAAQELLDEVLVKEPRCGSSRTRSKPEIMRGTTRSPSTCVSTTIRSNCSTLDLTFTPAPLVVRLGRRTRKYGHQ